MTRTRYAFGILLGLLTLTLAGYGMAAVWGLTVEYGAGLQVLLLAVTVPAAFAALTAAVWPGGAVRHAVLASSGLAVALLLGGLFVAHPLGLREREHRATVASETIGCNGPNAEISVDARVDEVFAELPRPTHLHGPVQGSRHGCGAGVAGGADGFEAWAEVLRGLDGYAVVRDQPRVVAIRRADGITVVLRRGAVPVLTVSTREGTDLGHNSTEFVSGTNRSRG